MNCVTTEYDLFTEYYRLLFLFGRTTPNYGLCKSLFQSWWSVLIFGTIVQVIFSTVLGIRPRLRVERQLWSQLRRRVLAVVYVLNLLHVLLRGNILWVWCMGKCTMLAGFWNVAVIWRGFFFCVVFTWYMLLAPASGKGPVLFNKNNYYYYYTCNLLET